MKIHTIKSSTIIELSLLILLVTSTVYAQDGSYVKDGTYIGGYFTKNNMSGDFNNQILGNPLGEFIVPAEIDDGTGFGIVLGHRQQKVAFELGYQRSRHDLSLFVEDASYSVIDFNFKVDVFERNQIRPYVLFGFGFPWITIEDGLYDYYDDSVEDATYWGWALNAGAGVSYYFQPQWAVTGGLIYRWNWFTGAEGGSLQDTLLEKAFCFRIGLAYTF